MKRVLLNVTAAELTRISGDISYYRNLLEAGIPSVEFALVRPLSGAGFALREMRKGLERILCARWPRTFNQILFPMARYSYLPPSALSDADAVLSHITFPLLPSCSTRPAIIWSTQGISPPSYYAYRGRVTFEDVVSVSNYFGRRADRLIVWTHSGAEIMRRYCDFSSPIHVLPPILPMPAPVARPLSREAEVHWLFVGREPRRKGLYDILNAFRTLGSATRRVQFDIVSCVPESIRAAYKGRPNIRFHESLSDDEVDQLFHRADVFLLPTHAETYGFVLIEAMARGCAIITCDYPPLNELVEHGKNGLLVPVGDSEAIARALGTFLQEPRLLRQCSENNRLKYQNTFAPDRVAAEFTKVLCA